MQRKMVTTMNVARSICLGIAALAAGSCIEPSAPSQRQSEPRIVFVSTRDGNEEIYTMNSDGTNQTRLTHNSVYEPHPLWSPGGTRIAFVSRLSGNKYI